MRLVQRTIVKTTLAGSLLVLSAGLHLNAQTCDNSTIDTQGAEVAKASRSFLAELQTAVRANDREKIAGMISYPLNVNYGTRRTRVPNKTALLASYDKVFTEQIRKDILSQSSHCLFGNDNGAMIGNGEVWFSGIDNGPIKVYAINVTVNAR